MNALKQSCKKNWYIIAVTFLLAVCTAVLTGIMEHNSFLESFDLLEFAGKSVLKVAILVCGVIIAFVLTFLFDNKFSGVFAAMFTVYAVLFSNLLLDSENWFYISLFAAILLLPFYYVNFCFKSVMHTVFYYIMTAVLTAVIAMSEEIEIFVILLTAIIMFAVNREVIRPKSALVINYICSFAAIIAMVCMLVEGMDDYFGIKFIEGDGYHLESLFLNTKPFGEAEYYHYKLEGSSLYNLAKIFRHFGYVAGTAMCVLITFFALSFFVRCFGNGERSRSVRVLAAITVTVRCIAGFFQNFLIISVMDVRIPILSDDIAGYLLVGIMLGFMLVSDDIVNGLGDTLNGILEKLFNKYTISKPEPEPDKPHLTLVGSKENNDV